MSDYLKFIYSTEVTDAMFRKHKKDKSTNILGNNSHSELMRRGSRDIDRDRDSALSDNVSVCTSEQEHTHLTVTMTMTNLPETQDIQSMTTEGGTEGSGILINALETMGVNSGGSGMYIR